MKQIPGYHRDLVLDRTPEEAKMTLAVMCESARTRRSMSIRQMAKRLGVSAATVHASESANGVSMAYVIRLVEAFGVDAFSDNIMAARVVVQADIASLRVLFKVFTPLVGWRNLQQIVIDQIASITLAQTFHE